MKFCFSIPAEVRFGRGISSSIGSLLKELGVNKALLVHGKGVARAGLTVGLVKSMEDCGVTVVDYDGVEPDPTDLSMEAGASLAKAEHVQAIVALGGGSAMDCAKGINILMHNHGPLSIYEGGDRVPNRGLPLICLPTTAGTSSEVTAVSIVRDTAINRKYVVAGRNVGADYALVDPNLTDGLLPRVAADSGMDALTHAIESYVSMGATPITKAIALKAAGIFYRSLKDAVNCPEAAEAREQMALGCVMVGCSFTNAGLGLVHAIAHALGAHFGIAHGAACAAMLPYVIGYNYACDQQGYDELREEIAPGEKKPLSELILELMEQINMRSLKEMGIPESELPFLAQETMKEDYGTNPNQNITPETVLELLRQAY